MAVDTPARIAIVGAGPIGLEAALYARFLGYDVEIFESGDVGENVRRWGHVRMFSPFRMNSTPLGLAALAAQDEAYTPPDTESLLTGSEWVERYLLPLSQSDLLADHLRVHTRVLAIARRDWLKQEQIGTAERADSPFRLLVQAADGDEQESSADVVIDASGVFQTPRWLGLGGAPARGERACRGRIRYTIPDIAGSDGARYAGRRVLVVGGGHSAATSVVALAQQARRGHGGRVVWAVRTPSPTPGSGPLRELPQDPLAERARLVQQANQALLNSQHVLYWPATSVASITWDDHAQVFRVTTVGEHAGAAEFDELIANVGFRPDYSFTSELQIHTCYATDGPIKIAAELLRSAAGDCLQMPATGPASLINPEPDFYLLGAKSYGRQSDFLVSAGHRQIRDLFSLIGDRESLDLYQGATRLPR